MKPEQQRIAIAKACGWRMIPSEFSEKSWIKPDGKYGGTGINSIPDYPNDLNAMHEAEKVLTPDQQDDFVYYLGEIAAPITGEEWMCIHATAAQRAEAFLRTLGLWEDGK